jgi:hypothetical protein
MKKSLITAALAGIAIVLGGAAALAGAQSVSTRPEPAFIARDPATTTTAAPDRGNVPPVTVDDRGDKTLATVDDHGGRSRGTGAARS